MSISNRDEKHPASNLDLLSDKPSLRVLLDRRTALNEQLNAYDDGADRLAGMFHENDKPELDRLEREYETYSDESDPDAFAGEIDYLLEHGKRRLSDSTLQTLELMNSMRAEAEPFAREELMIEKELDELYGQEFSDYVRSEASKLLSLVDQALVEEREKHAVPPPDIDGVVPREFETEMPPARAIIDTLKYIANSQNHSYGRAELTYDEVERSRAMLERWGVFRDIPKAETVAIPVSLEDMLVAGPKEKELYDAWSLNSAYRHYHGELLPFQAERKDMLPMHEWAVQLDEDERNALTRHLQSLDIAKEIERLEIDGLELLPFHYSEQELRAFLTTMPAIAFEGVTGIDFIHNPKNEQSVEGNLGEGWTTLGYHQHSLEENNARITIYVDEFIKRHESHPLNIIGTNDALEVVAAISREDVEGTIAHEVGHALHTKLPVSILKEWDDAVRGESVDVSTYVENMRTKDSHRAYIKEDFADTFTAFYSLRSRLQLERIAPARFMAMKEILDRTLPSAPDATAHATVRA